MFQVGRVLSGALLLLPIVQGCDQPFVPGGHTTPVQITAQPASVSVEMGQTIEVEIGFVDGSNRPLSAAQWLPQCQIEITNGPAVAVSIASGRVRIFGQVAGSATVRVRYQNVSATIAVEVTSPVPVITEIFPSITKGRAGELLISATGLTTGATVQVNGVVRPAQRPSPNHLRLEFTREETYDMPAGTLEIGVFNAPDGALSNVVLVPVQYPVPPAPEVAPGAVTAGSGDLPVDIHIRGMASENWNGFPTTKIRWQGIDLPSSFEGPNSFTATIPAGLLTTPGTYNITAFNQAPGGGVSQPYPFEVRPGSAAATAMFDFRNYEGVVHWAAAAMGNAAFSQVPVTNGVVQFSVTAPKATVAFVTSTGGSLRGLRSGTGSANVVSYQITVRSMTREEMTVAPHLMAFPRGTTPLAGTVSGVGAGELALLLWGNGEAAVSSAQPGFSIGNSTPGPHRLIGYRRTGSGPAPTDRVFARAGQPSAAGISVDFAGAESAPVATATASLSGLVGGDQAFGIMGYSTELTCEGTLWYSTPASSSFLITGIPPGLQGPDDVHLFRTLIFNGSHTLQQTFYSKALTGFAAVRPAPAAVPSVSTVATTPYLIRQAAVNLGGYEAGTFFYSTVTLTATKGFLGGAVGTIAAPDLSGVAGWNSAWAPPPSPAWTFGAASYVGVLQPCGNGTSVTTVSVSGSTP
jgi:hypothetical protein